MFSKRRVDYLGTEGYHFSRIFFGIYFLKVIATVNVVNIQENESICEKNDASKKSYKDSYPSSQVQFSMKDGKIMKDLILSLFPFPSNNFPCYNFKVCER